MDVDKVKKILINALYLKEIYVNKDNDHHYQIIAVSNQFLKLSVLQRQKIIYAPLMDYILNGCIHAVSIQAFTVMEWKREYRSIIK